MSRNCLAIQSRDIVGMFPNVPFFFFFCLLTIGMICRAIDATLLYLGVREALSEKKKRKTKEQIQVEPSLGFAACHID